MAIENSVSNIFLSTSIDNINILDCRLSGVVILHAFYHLPIFSSKLLVCLSVDLTNKQNITYALSDLLYDYYGCFSPNPKWILH